MSDPVYRPQTNNMTAGELKEQRIRSFRRWLYELGVEDEVNGMLHRFTPKPDWLTNEELNSYNAGRTDQRTGQAGRP